MRDEIRKFLWDIRQALRNILHHTSGKTLLEYRANRMMRGAVEREIQIVGEGIVRVHKAEPEFATRIPQYRHIIDSAI
jgi:uncharacterized protein with HEPN domain